MHSNYSHFLIGSLVASAALAVFIFTPHISHGGLPAINAQQIAQDAASGNSPQQLSLGSAMRNLAQGEVSFGMNQALADSSWPTPPANCPPPSCTLSFDQSSVAPGGTARLTWHSQYATSGYIANYANFPASDGYWDITDINQTTTFVATFYGPSGSVNCQATVYVNTSPPPPSPTCTLTATPDSIQPNQSFTLSWTSTDATGGSISDVGQLADPNGSVTITNQTQSEQFNGVFQGSGGTANCQTTVTVTQPPPPQPTCTLTINPSSVQAGQSATLSWTSQNATSGSIDHQIGSVGTSGSMSIWPPQSETITATFTGAGGSVNCQASVTVNNVTPPPTCTLTANPTNVASGAAVTLTWTSQNATSGTLDNGIGALSAVQGSLTVNPTQSTTYVATFTGAGGSVNCQATVTVNSTVTQPTCTLTASPTAINSGQSAVLTWTSQNATSASLSTIGAVGLSGSMTVYPTQTTTYTLTVTGAGGTNTCSTTITVNTVQSQPTCTLTASPTAINSGQSATLSWSSTNANSGYISGIGSVSPSGSQTIYPSQSTSYTATFTGSGGTANCYASVNVTQIYNYNYPQCTLTANPTIVNPGQPVTLYWSSQNANYGSITNIGSVSTNGSQTVYPNQTQVYQGTFSGQGGSVNCFVTVNANNQLAYVPPPQQPPAYVSLSQAPYTGLDLGPWGTAAYWAFLVAWCVLAAYLVGVKKIQNKLFDYVMGSYYGHTSFAASAKASGAIGFVKAQPIAPEPKTMPAQNPAPAYAAPAYASAANIGSDNFIMSQIKRGK